MGTVGSGVSVTPSILGNKGQDIFASAAPNMTVLY